MFLRVKLDTKIFCEARSVLRGQCVGRKLPEPVKCILLCEKDESHIGPSKDLQNSEERRCTLQIPVFFAPTRFAILSNRRRFVQVLVLKSTARLTGEEQVGWSCSRSAKRTRIHTQVKKVRNGGEL
jgi:hypothetical protein